MFNTIEGTYVIFGMQSSRASHSYVGRIFLWAKTFLRRKRIGFYLKNWRLHQIYLKKNFACWRSSVQWFLLTCRSQMFAKFIGSQRGEQKGKCSTSQVSRRWMEWMKQKVKWKEKRKDKRTKKRFAKNKERKIIGKKM